MVHCGGALGPGASGLPYYCTQLVCVFGWCYATTQLALQVLQERTQKWIASSLARGYTPAPKHCELFDPLVGHVLMP